MNEVSEQVIFVGKNKKDFPQRWENKLLLRHPKKTFRKTVSINTKSEGCLYIKSEGCGGGADSNVMECS